MIFEGKVALITGGNSGIGRAAALAFAREGARVVIAARNQARGESVVSEILEQGGEALFVSTDLSVQDQIDALFHRTLDTWGRIDCAFNNAAGHAGTSGLTADFSDEEFDHTMAVDLKGVWLCMKHEIHAMLGQKPSGGAIVNTSSVNGLGGVASASLYAAAKAGVIALTKSAAQEYARQGIRINVLVPGAFRTPMLDHAMDQAAKGDPEARARIEENYLTFIPAGRIGKPEEAAEAVLWMCSPAAAYLHGQSFILDGGMTSFFR